MSRVLNWNGKDVPKELRKLPAGRYVVEKVDQPPKLSAKDEEGLRQAMASIRAGHGVSLAEARRMVPIPKKRR